MGSVFVMTSQHHDKDHHHNKDHEPWHNLPTGFADHLETQAQLTTPVREAGLDLAAGALQGRPSHIIDLGSGTGVDAIALAQRFPSAQIHAVDVSLELLDRLHTAAAAANLTDRIAGHPADLNSRWPADIEHRAELVWAALSLHHVNDPGAVLNNVFESLQPGGALVMIELSASNPQAADHHRAAIDWERLLARAGFKSVVCHEYAITPEPGTPGNESVLGRAVWVAMRPQDQEPKNTTDCDVVVIGAGPAGLAAAIALARSRRSVVVIDAGQPRNAPASAAHNVLGNEGIAPHQLLTKGRAEAEAYGVTIMAGEALGVSGTIDAFTVEVAGADRVVHARRIILATGLIDDLPAVQGVEAGWGQSVLHCPFCHGWEVRDQRIAILVRDEVAVHQALLFSALSDQVTVFLHDSPDPSQEVWDQLRALEVDVVWPQVDRLIMDGAQVRGVQIDTGQIFDADCVVVTPRFHARSELYESLGGSMETVAFGSQIPTDPRGMTPVAGVWAAGNANEAMAMVVGSAAAGVVTGSAVHGDLAFADLNQAVETRRTRSL